MTETKAEVQFPAPARFLVEEPLYRVWKPENEDRWRAVALLYFQGTYDSFCTGCGKESTFQVASQERPPDLKRDHASEAQIKKAGGVVQYPALPTGVFQLTGTCARGRGHTQTFVLLVQIELLDVTQFDYCYTLQKIGQAPSFADLARPNLKQFAPVLSKPRLRELNAAVGLASHGVGIGAYAYLRRVFESLIEDARQVASAYDGWNDEEYLRARMGQRIAMLKQWLPSFLVENTAMYALLSKGLHELSEEDCLAAFPALLVGTELILDERLQAKLRETRIAEAKKALERHTRGHS